jgi:methyl-accepting chemotaxis protein
MFKNMKLGAKIGSGFGALIVISLAIGGLAVYSMSSVKTTTVNLADAKVPTVAIANDIERDALRTMYSMRGYVYTLDAKFLSAGRQDLAGITDELKKMKDHAAKTGDKALADGVVKAEAKVQEYEKLINDTVARNEAMTKDRDMQTAAAGRFTTACDDYLDSMNKSYAAEVKTFADAANGVGAAAAANSQSVKEAAMLERVKKINLMSNCMDLMDNVRVANWKAQTLRNPSILQDAQKEFDVIYNKLDELKTSTRQEVNLKQIEDCRTTAKAYNDAMTSYLANWAALEEINKTRGAAADGVLAMAKETSQGGMKQTSDESRVAAASLSTASLTMIIGLGCATTVGILLALFITRGITKPVNRIIETLSMGAEQTSSAAGQVSSSSQSLAQGASEQAAALEETTSALEEMSSMTKKNADTAQQAAGLSSEAQKSAAKGNEAMTKMSSAINDIQKSASETAKIIKVIDEIAFQTNLLALNAAVEAARAGEAGKGFAVVAEEVRNLAMRSAEAAKNTSAMIEESVTNAKNGVTIAGDVAKNLEEITATATKVNSLVGEIAAASKEQAQGIDQVNTAVGQMDKVTQSNAASAEESASASEELSSQAVQLTDMVGELVALVGTQNRNVAITSQANGHGKKMNHAAAKSRPVLAQERAPRDTASQVIPLNDRESAAADRAFSEFSRTA